MRHSAGTRIRIAVAAALLAPLLLPACGAVPAATLTPASWCDGFEQERLDTAGGMAGANRERLEAAQRLVAPGLGRTRAVSGLSLLAGYQEEMRRARPDVLTAAAYLATASGVPVTTQLVAQVNGFLCVTTTARRAAEVAAAAAGMQREMSEGSRT